MALTVHSAKAKDLRTAKNGVELQHRHFALIAAVLRDTKPPKHWDANKLYQWRSMVESFATELAKTNRRFNRERFLDASNAYDPDEYFTRKMDVSEFPRAED